MKIIILLLLVLTSSAYAEIYRWVDESGNVIFSDEQHKDAKQFELSPTTVYTPEPVNPEQQNESDTSQVITETPEDSSTPIPAYQLRIISPANEESVWANDGTVTVNVLIEPALDLERGDSLVVKLDDEKLQAPSGKDSVQFNNISRGTHYISASVVDKNGNVLDSSSSIQFHLHRASVLNRAK